MRSILPVGTLHRTIALTYDGKHVWVANKMSNNVMKFLAKGSLVDTIGVGQQHEALAFDGKDIWVANGGDNTITKLRVSDGASCTFKVGSKPTGLLYEGENSRSHEDSFGKRYYRGGSDID